MKAIFKSHKKEPMVHIRALPGTSPVDMPESEAYRILHYHIEKYKFYKEKINSLKKPEIDPENKEIYIKLITDACDKNINMNDWDTYASQFGLNKSSTARRSCFVLGEYLSNIISYGELLEVFQRSIDMEANSIKQIQIDLGIGVE